MQCKWKERVICDNMAELERKIKIDEYEIIATYDHGRTLIGIRDCEHCPTLCGLMRMIYEQKNGNVRE